VKTVTVFNDGNQPTGALTIGKSGANAGSFTVSETDLSSIGIGGNDSFTVVPNTGLVADTYTATITVSGGSGISASFNVSFTVNVPPTYSISLSEPGTYIFPGAPPGYGAQTPLSITVSNTGNQATGALTIGNTNAANFTVSATGLSSIAAGGNGSFTVVPNQGLVAGDYTATITVSGGHSISESFEVSFTVSANLYTVTFDADGGRPATSTKETYGSPVSLPADPVKSGYTFSGWYTEQNGGGTAFTPTTPVTEDIKVFAKWLSANANLDSLSVNTGELTPAFSPDIANYTVLVKTDSITVTAAAKDAGATLVQSPPNPVTLNPGANTIEVRVTAEDGIATKKYTITVNKTTEANAVIVVITRADERIDLTRSTEKDLSREAGDTLRVTTDSVEFDFYTWRVDGMPDNYDLLPTGIEIDLDRHWYNYGTHSVLLEYEKDGIPYGCEILFRVVR
jgi:uncharacterized repeat protein (TIGR02543 family)